MCGKCHYITISKFDVQKALLMYFSVSSFTVSGLDETTHHTLAEFATLVFCFPPQASQSSPAASLSVTIPMLLFVNSFEGWVDETRHKGAILNLAGPSSRVMFSMRQPYPRNQPNIHTLLQTPLFIC